jgi:hypothetical protein
MSEELYAEMPEEITVRQIRAKVTQPGYRPREIIIITTLTDADEYPADDIRQLYLVPWLARNCSPADPPPKRGRPAASARQPTRRLRETARGKAAAERRPDHRPPLTIAPEKPAPPPAPLPLRAALCPRRRPPHANNLPYSAIYK